MIKLSDKQKAGLSYLFGRENAANILLAQNVPDYI